MDHITKLCDVVALSRENCKRSIKANLVYAGKENFIGRPIDGYTPGVNDFALMTLNSALALCDVQNALIDRYNFGLLIFDSYRPKRAVLDFLEWSSAPLPTGMEGEYELVRKAIHYPHIEKKQLFNLGYVALDSQHCYGHTVDLALIDELGNELTLGAPFDFMDPLSHNTVTENEIGKEAFTYRKILSEVMQEFGFIPYEKEFWHFSFREKDILEPMDFVIDEDIKIVANHNISRNV